MSEKLGKSLGGAPEKPPESTMPETDGAEPAEVSRGVGPNAGTLVLSLLVAALLAFCLALFAKQMFSFASLKRNGAEGRSAENPLFAESADAARVDRGVPDGALRAETDSDEIIEGLPEQRAEFKKALEKSASKEALELEKRDAMAAKRLNLLKKLEAAKNASERAEIIKNAIENDKTP